MQSIYFVYPYLFKSVSLLLTFPPSFLNLSLTILLSLALKIFSRGWMPNQPDKRDKNDIGLFWFSFMSFPYNGIYFLKVIFDRRLVNIKGAHSVSLRKESIFAQREQVKLLSRPKKCSFQSSLEPFFTNYDTTDRKLKPIVTYTIVRKRTK